MTTLRNIIGTKSLAEVLADRDSIAQKIAVILDKATDPWGVKVERVEMYFLIFICFLTQCLIVEQMLDCHNSCKKPWQLKLKLLEKLKRK